MTAFVQSSRLIFDLGMNNGDDTAYYLARGYDVIALEANPSLVKAASARFADQLSTGRLKIVEAAIWEQTGHAKFHINETNDHWSSLDATWASRDDTSTRQIEVAAVTLGDLCVKFGPPLYVKIDVEGVDAVVLKQIALQEVKPLYVSVEDCRFGLSYVGILSDAGYKGFKLLDQSTVSQISDPRIDYEFPVGSSGPFGEDVPGSWLDAAAFRQEYSTIVRDDEGRRLAPRTRWWDIHARGER